MKKTRFSLMALAALLLCQAPVALAADNPAAQGEFNRGIKRPVDAKQVSQRLEFVETLINTSSGAKRVKESGNSQAAALRDKATDLLGDAKQAHGQGDEVKANSLLDQASNTMFEAVRMADGGQSQKEKAGEDYDRRLKSVEALLDAHNRIAKEKGTAEAKETRSRIEGMMDEAQGLKKAGKMDEARVSLDKAYVTAKLAIERMRRGDTLVRSLNFASKEEEFHYELDRNDTHQMLVTMLTKDKGPDPRIQGFVETAKGLREKAESQASRGDHGDAIKTLEESTQELIKAIRSAGIFIPS